MKILNNINGKFTSEAHKKEFNELNEEGLKLAQKKLYAKKQRELASMYQDPNKYGGMLHGYKGAQWQDEQEYNSASSGDETIGSPLLLNEVFRSVYIPVLSPNDDINL